MLSLKDIPNIATSTLLTINGRLDALAGKGMWMGWEDLRLSAGYGEGRTPAREAYEDGWYAGTLEKSREVEVVVEELKAAIPPAPQACWICRDPSVTFCPMCGYKGRIVQ